MNIHEHKAKEILKKFEIPVLNGVVIFDIKEIESKIKKLKSTNLIIKAQIHAGGRGKAGGIMMVKDFEELKKEAEKMLEKVLITHQTGKSGSKVRRLYIEETCDIEKEFYLSCLVDRTSSKIAFISSAEGGMDIEQVAKNNPEKIITIKLNISKSVNKEDVKKKHGKKQIQIWRRSWNIAPPPTKKNDKKKFANNISYANIDLDKICNVENQFN